MYVNNQLTLINFVRENATNISQNLLNESVQTGLTDTVLDKMFELTIGKYSKIDFSEIERSRGDITKIKYYSNLRECINILLDIHSVSDKIPSVVVISTALTNMLQLKNTFEHAFRIKNNIAIMIYNTFMYTIMEATSYAIATSIDFVKDNETNNFKANLYSDSKQHMLIEQLIKFNKTVADGTLIKFMGESYKAANTIQEGAFDTFITKGISVAANAIKDHRKLITGIGIASGVILLACNIIPLIRESIYLIYKTRQKLSDAAKLQSEFLELNIEILKNNGSESKIITRQEKWVKFFKNTSKLFSLESDKAERDAKKDMDTDKVDVSTIII